ncbi:electron transfer flavoprotein subunit beta/FixA family protein [Jonesia quinghaiensis]|uniref:electron transfer flavoprotein subunit beta/FixA family protein n=1 Tax=Jonesia quinghaiensis TaxID=262806 RepID=UPI00040C9EA9|nr:electron transfer flavoprotein subunit beta/FixA family protein [Jonesia quinghaiensis]
MRIVVPVKHVPDIHSDRSFTEEGRVARGVENGTLNELDENAIECALQLVEAAGPEHRAAHEVIVVTVGPTEAEGALRKAFQLGADTGVHVTDPAIGGSDVFGTATAVAAAIRKLSESGPIDLIITGMAALDGLGSVIPSLLAAELELPQLTLGTRFEFSDGMVEVTRELDGVTEVITAPAPAVVSVTDHVNTPRYPNFKLIMAARTKEIIQWSLTDIALNPNDVGEAAARTHVVKSAPRPPRDITPPVVDKGDGGLALARYLIDNDLI